MRPHPENQIGFIIDFDNIDIGYGKKYGPTAEVNWKKVSEIAVPYGREIDSQLIRLIEAEAPATEMEILALARILYGTVARQEAMEYFKDFRLKSETGL